MGRTKCAGCGTAVRGRRLCQACEVTDCYGEGVSDPKETETATADLPSRELEYKCTSCGTEYMWNGSDACPDCDSRRRRYIGPLEGEA